MTNPVSPPVNWLISLYDDDCEQFAHTAELLGHKAICVGRNDNLMEKDWREAFPDHSCVVFLGSLQFARDIQRHFNQPHYMFSPSWYPAVICDLNFLKYSNYSNYIQEDLLNWPYSIFPANSLVQAKDHFFDVYGNSDCLFIRPDSGFKDFTGQVVHKNDDLEEILDPYGYKSNNLVIVSEPKNIVNEYRCVIVEGKYITGSTYRVKGQLESSCIDIEDYIDPIFVEFVEDAASKIPHDVYVMDVAYMKNGEYKVIELNSFSCSSFYDCNKRQIIEAVSNWAEKEFARLTCVD